MPTHTLAEIPALDQPQLMYIDGHWSDAIGRKRLDVINPATEETVARVAFGDREDCKKAIDAASRRCRHGPS